MAHNMLYVTPTKNLSNPILKVLVQLPLTSHALSQLNMDTTGV